MSAEDEKLSPDEDDLVDLIAMENGGICIGYSDAHYGHPRYNKYFFLSNLVFCC